MLEDTNKLLALIWIRAHCLVMVESPARHHITRLTESGFVYLFVFAHSRKYSSQWLCSGSGPSAKSWLSHWMRGSSVVASTPMPKRFSGANAAQLFASSVIHFQL